VKRPKERVIGKMMSIVLRWRRYASGVNENGRIVKLNLDVAAKRMGFSKKSLDDYLLQMRFGSKLGFDFSAHYNDKVGVLRRFVSKQKKLLKAQGKSTRINQIETKPCVGLSEEFLTMLTDLRT